jgi:hypothetical protein
VDSESPVGWSIVPEWSEILIGPIWGRFNWSYGHSPLPKFEVHCIACNSRLSSNYIGSCLIIGRVGEYRDGLLPNNVTISLYRILNGKLLSQKKKC